MPALRELAILRLGRLKLTFFLVLVPFSPVSALSGFSWGACPVPIGPLVLPKRRTLFLLVAPVYSLSSWQFGFFLSPRRDRSVLLRTRDFCDAFFWSLDPLFFLLRSHLRRWFFSSPHLVSISRLIPAENKRLFTVVFEALSFPWSSLHVLNVSESSEQLLTSP